MGDGIEGDECLRIGVYLIQEPASISLIEHPRKPPWLFLERLHILDLDYEHVPRLRSLDLERTSQVMNLGQIDVLHVIGAVIILDLPACPVDTFDLDDLAIFYGSIEGDYILRESTAYGRRVCG